MGFGIRTSRSFSHNVKYKKKAELMLMRRATASV